MMGVYVRPIAYHLAWPERLLLRDEGNRWYVWLGESPDAKPAEIAEATAFWLLSQRWICRLPDSTPWVEISDLPLAILPPISRP